MLAVIESMNGARFIHDRLELAGWDVRLADPQRQGHWLGAHETKGAIEE